MTSLPPGPTPTRNPVRRFRALAGIVADPFGFVAERFERFGDTYHVDEGGGGHLFVTRDPDVIRDVLVTRATSFRKAGGVNDRLRRVLGEGLLTADGDTWRRKRRLIQPSFRQKAIAAYGETMIAHAEALDWSDGEVVDLSDEMMRLTLRIVCKALFDHDVTARTDIVGATMDALREGVQPGLLPSFVPTPRRRRMRRALRDVDGLIAEMVRARADAPDGVDLLSMLVAAELPPDEVRDELVTFFLAGHETTSHALTFTWRLLADHPQTLARIEAEVAALGERPPTLADLEELPTLDGAIKEAMRLYPPAFAVGRVAAAATEVGGFRMEPGWQIVSWIWHCHRNPRWFTAPDAFQPDRHVSPTHPPHAYLPFGGGTRMCIGEGFARMEMRLLLASLIRRYRLEATGPWPGLRPRVTLSPAGPMRMRVRRRVPGPGP